MVSLGGGGAGRQVEEGRKGGRSWSCSISELFPEQYLWHSVVGLLPVGSLRQPLMGSLQSDHQTALGPGSAWIYLITLVSLPLALQALLVCSNLHVWVLMPVIAHFLSPSAGTQDPLPELSPSFPQSLGPLPTTLLCCLNTLGLLMAFRRWPSLHLYCSRC